MIAIGRTVRGRITVVAVIACAALLATVSVTMVLALRRQLTDNLDESLGQRADALVAAAGTGPWRLPVGADEDLLVQLVAPSGAVVASTSVLDGEPPLASTAPGARTVRGPGESDMDVRVLTRSVDDGGGGRLALLVGANADDITDPVRELVGLLVVLVPSLLAVLAVLVWWITGRTLRPVARMRAEMAAIGATDLTRRVPRPGTGDEIDQLAGTMNATLDRLEEAVRRQQRFVADASHELRGPLTRMRTELEVDRAHPERADPEATARSVLDETIGLERLVGDLLLLARSDAGVPSRPPEVLDLDEVVRREARRVIERGGVRVDTRALGAIQVVGDAAQLGRAVRNLVENAERHAASSIVLTLAAEGDVATLTVSDDGAGIGADDRLRVFERFTRLDDARTRESGGAGLGLAIVRDVVERHGGAVNLLVGTPTTFVVTLPVHVATRRAAT